MNVDQLHQLQKRLFEDHTWELTVGFPKDIDDQERGLDLMDERLSMITHFSDIC